MRAWKTCPTGARHQGMGRGFYKPGVTVEPCDPDGPDHAHYSWLWGCDSFAAAMDRGKGMYKGDPALFDIWELKIPGGVRIEGFPWSGGKHYLRFKRCVVIERAFGTAPLVYAPQQLLPPPQANLERIAQLRADVTRDGRRQPPDPDTTNAVDRRVLELLDT